MRRRRAPGRRSRGSELSELGRSTIVGRVDQNDAIFKKILDDEDFKQTLLEFYAARLYERLRGDDQFGLAPA